MLCKPTRTDVYKRQGEFHRKHARIVGDVMRWYANELGYGAEADFWQTVGILHDLDFEQWPEQHCTCLLYTSLLLLMESRALDTRDGMLVNAMTQDMMLDTPIRKMIMPVISALSRRILGISFSLMDL